MLTLNAVAALILLFVLLPVAKLTRRLIFTLMEQIDHGDVHEQGKGHVSRATSAIASAGFVASAAWREAKREEGKRGSTGGSTPNRGNPNEGGMGRAGQAQESETVRAGYLPEKREGASPERRDPGPSNNGMTGKGSPPAHDMGSNQSTILGKDGQPLVRERGNLPIRMSRSQRERPGRPPFRSTIQKGSLTGGKWMGYPGAAISSAAGIGASAAFGPLAGRTLASSGSKMFRRTGQLTGAATGAAVYGSRRMYDHVRHRTSRPSRSVHRAVTGINQSYRSVKGTTAFSPQSNSAQTNRSAFNRSGKEKGTKPKGSPPPSSTPRFPREK